MSMIPSSNFGYGRIDAYRQAAATQQVRQVQQPTEVQQAAPAAARPAAAAAGLSQAEQQMIDRYFPPAPALTLRLYGPNRSAQQLNPNAVGGRLDLKG